MFGNNTDRQWETLGAADPYFAVATHEENRRARLTAGQKDAFFASGKQHIDHAFRNIELHLLPAVDAQPCAGGHAAPQSDSVDCGDAACTRADATARFRPRKALDFGCGVGRLVVPLAGYAEEVVGVDVADSMLAEATSNCRERGLTNVCLVKGDDQLSNVNGKFDFIHSCHVFQHIPPKRGLAIFERLVDSLADGGVGVVHFKYYTLAGPGRLLSKLKRLVPFGHYLSNILRGRAWNEPAMEMNAYDLSTLLSLLQRRGVPDVYLTFEPDALHLSATLYFRRGAAGRRRESRSAAELEKVMS